MRCPGHPRPHHLVVVEGHPAVDEGPGPRLADVVEQGGQAQQPVRRRLVHHGQGVAPARPCGGGSGPARGPGPGSSGRNSSARPVRTTNHSAVGRAPAAPRSCRARRGSARPRRSTGARGRRCDGGDAAPGRARGRSAAMKRAARSIRSGSSAKETSGSSGVRSRRAARSPSPSKGSMSSRSGRRRAMRVDGEVPAGQVVLDVVAEAPPRACASRARRPRPGGW